MKFNQSIEELEVEGNSILNLKWGGYWRELDCKEGILSIPGVVDLPFYSLKNGWKLCYKNEALHFTYEYNSIGYSFRHVERKENVLSFSNYGGVKLTIDLTSNIVKTSEFSASIDTIDCTLDLNYLQSAVYSESQKISIII